MHERTLARLFSGVCCRIIVIKPLCSPGNYAFFLFQELLSKLSQYEARAPSVPKLQFLSLITPRSTLGCKYGSVIHSEEHM